MSTIPASHKDLLGAPVYTALTTVMPDGQPQSTLVWCSYDGDHIWVNSTKGRQKDKNMHANPKVTLLSVDPQNPFRWIEVRGTVDTITEDGAVDHIDQLAQAYMNKQSYYGDFAPADLAEKETRVIYKIKPTKVTPFQVPG